MKKSSRKKLTPRSDELKRKIKYNRKKDGFKKHKARDYKSWIQSSGATD
jgi:hypothetical protein